MCEWQLSTALHSWEKLIVVKVETRQGESIQQKNWLKKFDSFEFADDIDHVGRELD